jgi:hypothetical protein
MLKSGVEIELALPILLARLRVVCWPDTGPLVGLVAQDQELSPP